MSKAGIVAVLLLFFVGVANAATQCYRADEIAADLAVRYQEKLMVLSDSCGNDSYTLFVRRNASLISFYQERMIDYFRRRDGHRAENAFDRFMTRLANEMSLDVGRQRLATVCTQSAQFFAQALAFTRDDFRRYVATQAATVRRRYPLCAAD